VLWNRSSEGNTGPALSVMASAVRETTLSYQQKNSQIHLCVWHFVHLILSAVCLQTFCYEAKIVRTGVHGHKHEQWPHLWSGRL
jgi:hypothetical protein